MIVLIPRPLVLVHVKSLRRSMVAMVSLDSSPESRYPLSVFVTHARQMWKHSRMEHPTWRN